jgi:hypothetical protein
MGHNLKKNSPRLNVTSHLGLGLAGFSLRPILGFGYRVTSSSLAGSFVVPARQTVLSDPFYPVRIRIVRCVR